MIANLPILPFRSNWASSIKLRSTFVNAGAESIGGSKRRVSRRDCGQRELEFYLLPQDDDRRSWDLFRELYPPNTVIGIPLWSEEGPELTADVDVDATVLPVTETASIDWRAEAALWSLLDSAVEGLPIASIAADSITLSSGLETPFARGSKVLPLFRARHDGIYSEELQTPRFSQIIVTASEDLAAMSAPSISPIPAALTYKSLPLFPFLAEWSDPVRDDFTQQIRAAATGLNAAAYATLKTYARRTVTQDIKLDSRADRAALWQFFHDRRGRWKRFWLPPSKCELVLAANAASNATALTLDNFADYSDRFAIGDKNKVLFIWQAGRFWIRKVTNLSGGADAITIDAATGAALNKDATQIGLMTLVHFAIDQLEVELLNPLLGQAQLAFEEAEKEYTEVLAASGTLNGTITDFRLSTS